MASNASHTKQSEASNKAETSHKTLPAIIYIRSMIIKALLDFNY